MEVMIIFQQGSLHWDTRSDQTIRSKLGCGSVGDRARARRGSWNRGSRSWAVLDLHRPKQNRTDCIHSSGQKGKAVFGLEERPPARSIHGGLGGKSEPQRRHSRRANQLASQVWRIGLEY